MENLQHILPLLGKGFCYDITYYTPRLWRAGCNSFDIVCLSVHPSRYPDRTHGQTDLNFCMEVRWKDIEVKFVDQGHRSKVKVTRSKNVHRDVPLTSESLVYGQRRNSGIQLVGIRRGVFLKHMWVCPPFLV